MSPKPWGVEYKSHYCPYIKQTKIPNIIIWGRWNEGEWLRR
jgi:hypothetical protein